MYSYSISTRATCICHVLLSGCAYCTFPNVVCRDSMKWSCSSVSSTLSTQIGTGHQMQRTAPCTYVQPSSVHMYVPGENLGVSILRRWMRGGWSVGVGEGGVRGGGHCHAMDDSEALWYDDSFFKQVCFCSTTLHFVRPVLCFCSCQAHNRMWVGGSLSLCHY